MSEYKKNKDIFLQSIGNVKPLKKSNRNFKEINLSSIKKMKVVKAEKLSNKITPKTKIEKEVNKNNLNKESYLLKRKLRKGDVSIDRKVDFHGLSLEKAKRKFYYQLIFAILKWQIMNYLDHLFGLFYTKY